MITTRASASASELVINALRPFIPVVIVGDTTYGKPVGQYSFTFCDKVLNPVSFILRNAQRRGRLLHRLHADLHRAPTTSIISSAIRPRGSLAEAFVYLQDRRLHAAAADDDRVGARQRRLRAPRPILPTDGWQQLLGAH